MASAIRALVRRYDVNQLWLIGHSGGGALAMLLAEKLPQVTRIPPPLVKPVIMRQGSASGIEVPGFNHGCCWERIWPSVLRALAQDDPYRIPGVNFKSRTGKVESSGSR